MHGGESSNNGSSLADSPSDPLVQKYCELHVLLSEGEDLIPTAPEDLFFSVLYVLLFVIGFLANIVVIVTLGTLWTFDFSFSTEFFFSKFFFVFLDNT